MMIIVSKHCCYTVMVSEQLIVYATSTPCLVQQFSSLPIGLLEFALL